jgi:hypothetical protein
MTHPEDMLLMADLVRDFILEFQAKFQAGSEEHFDCGPLEQRGGKLRDLKHEILDAWSYVKMVERRDKRIVATIKATMKKEYDAEKLADLLYDIIKELNVT